MGRPRVTRLDTAYPPRLMRAERAAAYLDMSESSFLRLVELGEVPPGTPVKGMVSWDRHELDAAVENWKARRQEKPKNTVAAALGITE